MKKRPKYGELVALLGAERPEDALKFLTVMLAKRGIKGVIVATVDGKGECDSRIYGVVTRGAMAWVGSQLVHEAHGE